MIPFKALGPPASGLDRRDSLNIDDVMSSNWRCPLAGKSAERGTHRQSSHIPNDHPQLLHIDDHAAHRSQIFRNTSPLPLHTHCVHNHRCFNIRLVALSFNVAHNYLMASIEGFPNRRLHIATNSAADLDIWEIVC